MSDAGYRRLWADMQAGKISEQAEGLPLFDVGVGPSGSGVGVSRPTDAPHTRARLGLPPLDGQIDNCRQLPPFVENASHTRARLTDPPTSHAAAEGSRESARAQRAAIVACLRQYGAMTADELDARLHWPISTAGKRISELRSAGLIVETGDTRRTRRGQPAEVYQARAA